jgi:hypothetical protein
MADANSSLGDANSSLGDAKSSLGDAESSLGDAKSSLGDAKTSLGDAESSLGDAKISLGDAKISLGDAKSSLGDAKSSLDDAKPTLSAYEQVEAAADAEAAWVDSMNPLPAGTAGFGGGDGPSLKALPAGTKRTVTKTYEQVFAPASVLRSGTPSLRPALIHLTIRFPFVCVS